MDFNDFSVFNRRRCEAPRGFHHQLADWSLSDWMTAVMGELGEAANIAKKLNRVRDGIPGNVETPDQLKMMLADEIADTFIYLDLLAQSQGFNLQDAVLDKFQRTSTKLGYDDALFRRSV
jgi:NTP pyrophosphatase (non-canonical NTP hydrolase)